MMKPRHCGSVRSLPIRSTSLLCSTLAYMRYSLSQFAEAMPLLERAVRARPDDFGAHYLLGATLIRMDHRDQDCESGALRSRCSPEM